MVLHLKLVVLSEEYGFYEIMLVYNWNSYQTREKFCMGVVSIICVSKFVYQTRSLGIRGEIGSMHLAPMVVAWRL